MTNHKRATLRYNVVESGKPRLSRHQKAAIRQAARDSVPEVGTATKRRLARANVQGARDNP